MIGIPDGVKALLAASVRRVRRIYLLRGLAATLSVAIAATLAVMAVDACFTLFSDAVRWILSFALYLCVFAAGWFTLVRPLARPLDARRMAKILDARHPENEECLTTLVELVETEGRKSGRPVFSEDLMRLLSQKAAAAADAVDVEREFTSRTIIRRLKALVVIAVLLALSFAVVPHLAGRLFVRAVAPWVDVGNLYANDIDVKPGDMVVLGGTVVRIEAKVGEGVPYSPSIRISRRTALGWGEEFAEAMDGGVYEATADLAEPEWRYRVCAGPAVSRYYTVRVCEMPKYESFSARIDYPAYTGFSPSVVSNDDVSTLGAIEGSRVSFALDLGSRAVKASLRIDRREADVYAMVSNRVAEWTLDLVGEEGFAAPRRGGLLKSFVDAAPTVVVEQPASKSLRLAPHAKFPLVVSASDDIGIAHPTVRCSLDGGAWSDLRPMATCEKAGASLWKGRDEIDLSTLDLSDARTVAFDVVVHDRYPAACGGPHSATSTPIVVQLEMKAASLETQSLAEEVNAARKLLDEARRRLDDALHPANRAKEQIRREQKVSEQTDKDVERAVHETSEARKRIDELERRFLEDRRFEPIAESLKDVREQKLDPALAKLEAAQFDAPEQRAAALEAALPEMREALDALRQMDESIRERAQNLENYEKTKDLAARQEALARAAEDLLREKPVDTRKLEAWKRMQDEAASQARQLEDNFRLRDGDMDDARRKMAKAADLMDELKHRMDLAADRNRSELRKAQADDQYGEELSRRRDEALRQAVAAEKDAERNMEQARANSNKGMREDFMRRAAAAQSRAEDLLEQAEARAETKEAQRAASAERKEAMDASSAKDDAIDRQGEARRAAEAELAAREKTRRDEAKARKDRDEAARRALAEQGGSERREAQQREARAAAMKAQARALSAFDEAAKSTDENRGRQLRQQAADAAQEASRQLARSGVEPALADAQEKTRDAARAAVENPSAVKPAHEAQRRSAEALEAADKAEQLSVAAAAKELAERLGGEHNLPEDVMQGLERLQKTSPESTARQLREAASAAKEDAARKLAEAVQAANRAMGVTEPADAAQDAAQNAGGEEGSSPPSPEMENSAPARAGDRASVGEKAAEAAAAMRNEAARQAKALGISERGDQSSNSSQSPTQAPQESPSGGGIAAEIAQLARDLQRKDSPAAAQQLFERLGWFRIKGAAKDGLGDRELKDIPAEYLDLVRAYFLKLAEEK